MPEDSSNFLRIFEDEAGQLVSVVLVATVILYLISARFIKRLDKLYWFVVYFGFGTALVAFATATGWAGSGNLWNGFLRLVFERWDESPMKVFAIFYPPTAWLNFLGALICTKLRRNKSSWGYRAGAGLIAVGFFLTFFVLYAVILDPSGL